jgi:CHASE3 domain sensor protein
MRNEFYQVRKHFLVVGAAATTLLVGGLAWCLWDFSAEQAIARETLDAKHEIVSAIDTVLIAADDAETGQRGFVLTGREHYLEPFESGSRRMTVALDRLTALLRDEPGEQRAIRRLRTLVHDKLAELDETIALRRNEGRDAALDVVLTDRGKRTMDDLRGVLAQLRADELRVLSAEQAGHDRLLFILRYLVIGLGLVAVGAVGVTVWAIRWSKRLQAGLVTMCAWTRQIRHEGEWVSTEEYLFRRFGLNITHGISDAAARRLVAESEKKDPAESRSLDLR